MYNRKDPRRQMIGAASKAQGKQFEDRLDRSFAYYRSCGIAIIEKTPEPMRPTQNLGNGRFIAFFEKKAQPDYKGIVKGGYTVILEAKFTSTDRIEQSRVFQKQADYLDRYLELGAHCCIIAGFSTGAVYRFPWNIWRNMKQYFGRKYVTEADAGIADYRVPVARNGILLLLDKTEGSLQ